MLDEDRKQDLWRSHLLRKLSKRQEIITLMLHWIDGNKTLVQNKKLGTYVTPRALCFSGDKEHVTEEV
jgi:hypothetical protein